MELGYVRVSKADGSQTLDLQVDAMSELGIADKDIYRDFASGKQDDRAGLDACLKALREGDTLVVWKLDRLGRNLKHLVSVVHELNERGVGFKVLTGQGATIDTTTPSGKLVFGIFAALAEYEREQIYERTMAGLKSARARGRLGGRPMALSKHQVLLAQSAMKDPKTKVRELCEELGISRQALYKYVGPKGELRPYGIKILGKEPAPEEEPCSVN